MDPFNLSRYANLTIQRVQAPEEKSLPETVENNVEENCSSDKDDNCNGSEEEASKTQVSPKIETDPEVSDILALADKVQLEVQNIEDQPEGESKNNEQNDEENETNSKRKSGEEEDDQTPKKAKMNEETQESKMVWF